MLTSTTGNRLRLIMGATALALACGSAAARDNITFTISIGGPVRVHAPPAIHVAAPPVYVYSGYAMPVLVPPRVVHYAPPRHVRTPHWHGHGHGHGRWNRETRHGWR